MTVLHPWYFLAGIAIGALAAQVVAARPERRGLELAGAALVAGIGLALATAPGAALVLALVVGPVVGGAVGAVVAAGLERAAGGTTPTIRGAWWIAAVGVVTAGAYLSVPDTEGPVLLGGLVLASFVPWLLAGWRATPRRLGAGVGALTAVTIAAAVAGAGGRWTPLGWIVAKALLVLALGLGGVVAWRTRGPVTSAPEPPSP